MLAFLAFQQLRKKFSNKNCRPQISLLEDYIRHDIAGHINLGWDIFTHINPKLNDKLIISKHFSKGSLYFGWQMCLGEVLH